MSSLRAIALPTQHLETVAALETEAYHWPQTGPPVPRWAERVEETIRVIARLGFSPTPTIVLVAVIVISASFRPA
jgi:hypothetical protein